MNTQVACDVCGKESVWVKAHNVCYCSYDCYKRKPSILPSPAVYRHLEHNTESVTLPYSYKSYKSSTSSSNQSDSDTPTLDEVDYALRQERLISEVEQEDSFDSVSEDSFDGY